MPITLANNKDIHKDNRPSESALGVILVGGQSRRMGFAKEQASIYDKCTMLEHIANVMANVCSNILIVGKTEDRLGISLSKHNNILFSPDNEPGLGPLSGISTALEFAKSRYAGCLVIACDQPLVQAETLRLLVRNGTDSLGVFFQDSSLIQPLPGYYPIASKLGLQACLNNGLLSLRKAIDYIEKSDISILRLSIANSKRNQLTSANDPETLERVRLHFANHI